MKKRCTILVLTAALLLCACRPQSEPALPSPVATQIEAVEEDTDFFHRRYYNTSGKIQKVLLVIRALQPRFAAAGEPDQLMEPTLRLTLVRSDGTVRQYRMKGLRYWQEGEGQWKKVKSEAAAELWRTLWSTPSDPEELRIRRSSGLPFLENWMRFQGGQKPDALWKKKLGKKK